MSFIEIPLDALLNIRQFTIHPADYFRLGHSSRVLMNLPDTFEISVIRFLKLLRESHFPFPESLVSKLRLVRKENESPTQLTTRAIDAIMWNIPSVSNMYVQLLESEVISPVTLFEAAVKENKPEIASLALDYFKDTHKSILSRELRRCVVRGYTGLVVKFLSQGVTIPDSEQTSDSLLHVAVYHGHTEIVLHLLQKAADGSARDSESLTPFLLACQEQHLEIVKLLLNHRPTSIHDVDAEGRNCISLTIQRNPSIDLFRFLLDSGANHVSESTLEGTSPIHYACAINRVDLVQLLIQRGVDITKVDTSGLSCLDVASVSEKMYTLLLNNGVFINPNTDYIARAARVGKLELCKLLVERGVKVFETSTLIRAVDTTIRNNDCVRYLLALGGDVNAVDSRTLESALYIAVINDNEETCKILLDAKADVNTTFHGKSMWKIAARDGFDEICHLLSEYGATPESN